MIAIIVSTLDDAPVISPNPPSVGWVAGAVAG